MKILCRKKSTQTVFTNDSGSIAVGFGLSAVALSVAAFAAINSVNFNRLQTEAQASVDSAALALASGLEKTKYQAVAELYVAKNFTTSELKNKNLKTTYDKTKSAWTVTLTGNFDSSMNSIFGESKLSVTSTAVADLPLVLSDVTFTPGLIQGWFDKTVTLFGVDNKTKKNVNLWSINYKWNLGSPIVNMSAKSAKITNYNSLYLRMDIDPNSYRYDEFGTYLTSSTNTADGISWIMIDGKVLTAPLDLATAVGCNQSKSYQWEDGGNHDYQDFIFQATGTCAQSGTPVGVRLTN